jgi:beta-lactamase class A
MIRLIASLLLSALLVFGFSTASAEENTAAIDGNGAQVIRDLLSDAPISEAQFTPQFLAQVPVAQVEQLLAEIKSTIGPVESVTRTADGYTVETRTHSMPVQITLDIDGRIAGLIFRPPVQSNASVGEIAAQFDELEGEVAYLVTTDGEVVAQSNADAPLAVGSAFKLGILALLNESIEAGEHSWDEVVTLERGHISLPTGILQTFPPGSPVALHTAAALMISISDNTATDLLIDVVGRQALAETLGIDFALTTREFFFLKGDIETREAYLAASPEEKLEIVEDLANRPMPALNPNLPLHDQGIEWYVPATRLCELIDGVAHLDIMSINPGVATAGDWANVAYKGGSETGVLNLTTHLTAEDGAEHCVVLTINAPTAFEATTPTSIYASVLAALAPEDGEEE